MRVERAIAIIEAELDRRVPGEEASALTIQHHVQWAEKAADQMLEPMLAALKSIDVKPREIRLWREVWHDTIDEAFKQLEEEVIMGIQDSANKGQRDVKGGSAPPAQPIDGRGTVVVPPGAAPHYPSNVKTIVPGGGGPTPPEQKT